MSNQSFTNRIMDPEERSNAIHELSAYESRNRRPLIVGALVGLLLGLFIAWVVWPIQWSNAWPPDLADQAKADYIAAVADAFAASRSDDAADLAYRRLSSFGDDMQAELSAAILYFETHPSNDGAVRINNIQDLAAAVQPMPTPVPTTEGADTAYPAEVDEQPADSVAPVDPQDPSNWLQRTLWLLAALALIVGGILVLRAVTRPQPAEPYQVNEDDDDDEIDEFDQDDLYAHLDEPSGQDETSSFADRSAATASATAAATVTASGIDMDVDEAGEGEVDVEILATDPVADNPSISVRSGTAGAALDSAFLADQEAYGFGPETDLPTDGGSTTVFVDAEPEPEVNSSAGPEEEIVEATATAAADSAFQKTPGRELGRYSAVYYPMSDEYAEAFRIEDDADAGYVGECGMGVNMKYGLVQRNPEQVAALDVWLVDYVEKTATSYHSQTLISKYGVAKKSDENQDSDVVSDVDGEQLSTTLTAPAAGDRFQIVGEHLFVDCEVVKASYMESGVAAGVFQGLELKLVVSRWL